MKAVDRLAGIKFTSTFSKKRRAPLGALLIITSDDPSRDASGADANPGATRDAIHDASRRASHGAIRAHDGR